MKMDEAKKVSKMMVFIILIFYAMAASATIWGNENGIHACALLLCATVWHVGNIVVFQIWRMRDA